MSKRRRKKQGPIREEKDRPLNPYWSETDEDEHTPVEDDYNEESGPNIKSEYGEILDTKNRRNSENW